MPLAISVLLSASDLEDSGPAGKDADPERVPKLRDESKGLSATPLDSILTKHPATRSHCEALSLVLATLTNTAALSPLECILTKNRGRGVPRTSKSFQTPNSAGARRMPCPRATQSHGHGIRRAPTGYRETPNASTNFPY